MTICDDCEFAERCEQNENFICPYDDNEPINSEIVMLCE